MSRRRRLAALLLFLLCCGRLPAGGIPYDELPGAFDAPATPLQLGLFPAVALFDSGTPVYGAALGMPMLMQGKVRGIQVGGVAAITGSVIGVTVAPINIYDENFGIAIGMLNLAAHDFGGGQIGIWNTSLSRDEKSFQLGGVNIAAADGVQIGGINVATGNNVQFGIVNRSGSGLQFGLLNYSDNPDAWLPFTLLFNFVPEN